MKLDPISLEILGEQTDLDCRGNVPDAATYRAHLVCERNRGFCCALAGLDGKFFAYPRALGVSGFVGLDCSTAIAAVGALEPGDVILTNDPYRSGGLATHLPDLQVIEPYFHEGRIVAYGWGFLHASDVGGKVPSSISPSNHEIFQEGLQIPPLKIMRAGHLNQDVALPVPGQQPHAGCQHGRPQGHAGGARHRPRTGRADVQQHWRGQALLDAQSDLVEYAALRARAVLAQVRRRPTALLIIWMTKPAPACRCGLRWQ